MGNFSSPASARVALQARTAALVALFDQVGRTRMQGVPILNPALQVAAIGFEVPNWPVAPVQHAQAAMNNVASEAGDGDVLPPDEPPAAVGILITPWFMNLVWLSLVRVDEPGRSGSSRSHAVGAECFDFIAGHEASFGSYEACSLFSPMFEFPDQASAVATAHSVLEALRCPPVPQSAPSLAAPPARPAAGGADRRAFLFGRRAAPSGVAP